MSREWTRYWREADRPLEAMHAHLVEHTYHLHSHDTYSFGVTDAGAQAFTCRGAAHTSAAGMVMAFNPDDPHDGRTATDLGFTYRIVHIGPEVIADVLAGGADRAAALPLFREPVVHDALLAEALRGLHASLLDGSRLERDEQLGAAVSAMVRRAATGHSRPRRAPANATARASVVRDLLEDLPGQDFSADELAAAAGQSRFGMYRAFRAVYGMAPSDYQRQVRLRAARAMLRAGHAPASIAAEVGFADQAHLTRWFGRYYGITPGVYRRSAS